jgi:hypothetical protein
MKVITPPRPKPKKRINSKNKGGTFERLVAKQLSLWYSKNSSDDIFYRTASSGGRSTQRTKRGQSVTNSAGDLSFLDSAGEPFLKCCAVEIKIGYPAATLNKILTSEKPELLAFFQQAQESAKQANVPHWIVIHKQDRQPTLLYCNLLLLRDYYKVKKIQKNNNFHFPFVVIPLDKETMVAALKFDTFLTLDPAVFCPELLFPNQ